MEIAYDEMKEGSLRTQADRRMLARAMARYEKSMAQTQDSAASTEESRVVGLLNSAESITATKSISKSNDSKSTTKKTIGDDEDTLAEWPSNSR